MATTLAKGRSAVQAPGALALRRILCPIDFSELSPLAMDQATELARASGAEITALFVFPAPPEAERDAAPAALPEAALRATVTKDLERFLAPARQAGIPVHVVLATGDAAHEITAAAGAAGSDLIVMGTHGRSGFGRWALGSTAQTVLRTARCAVLTVAGAEREIDAAVSRDGGGIVCALELNEAAAPTLETALSLARLTGRKVTLVHVLADMSQYQATALCAGIAWEELRADLEDDARQRLLGAAAAAGGGDCLADVIVAYGKPYREVLRIAGERDASLIVMGIHGRAPLHRFFFGSNAEHVVREAGCPVLTVRGA